MNYKIITLLLVFISTFAFAQDDWKTLEKDNFSLIYPSHWEYSEKKPQPSVKFLLFAEVESQKKDFFRENINLNSESLKGQNMSLSEYTKISIDNIKAELPTANFISNTSIKVNGIDVSDIVWSNKFGKVDLKFRQFLMVYKGEAYVITYTATASEFDDYGTIANTILNSFKFTK
ncbi:PsbP-related protein [Psychroserpens sp. SPM9]|uniref:PsbP-related protein n=1 Tax=Psychroserpens sp. SPM9 TaxID=2975598 RepID=UPI0021A4CCAC|nr:PsbP-related protein [Psychroserpens sp. SPM9]MDG5492814.1 PsbP-related protein [Psychroserpens sp. SPM9]